MHIKLDLTKFKLSKHTNRALCSTIACSILYPDSTKLYPRERKREENRVYICNAYHLVYR